MVGFRKKKKNQNRFIGENALGDDFEILARSRSNFSWSLFHDIPLGELMLEENCFDISFL